MNSRIVGGCLIVDVDARRIDFASAEEFKRYMFDCFERFSQDRIILNLKKVDFIDSKAIGALVGINKKAQSMNKTLVLVEACPYVSKIISVVTLNAIFKMHYLLKDALGEFGEKE